MKHLILTCMVVVCLLAACNNDKKTVDPANADSTAKAKPETSLVTEEMKKQSEELQKLTPLTADELKALLPQQIMGAKGSKFEVTPAAGANVATAAYILNDSTEIQVSISDCGGAAGAGLYSNQYLKMIDMQSDNDNEYTKTIDFRGKAVEHCQKTTNRCTLTYFTGKRYMVTLEGKNIHPDGLKQAAMELTI
jgi:hypothetical protein